MAYYNPNQEQPQIQVQYPAPIVYYAAPAITYQSTVVRPYGPYYEKQTSIGLGATQIVLACLSIAAGAMAIVYGAGWYPVGIGIWGGCFFLIAGALSLAAGKDPANGLITGTLVFSVFNIIIGVAMITIASFGVTEDLYCNNPYYNSCSSWWGAAVAANALMIAIGALEFIFGIWMTVISGRAIDRGSKAQLATMPVAFAQNHQPQTMYIQAPPPNFQPQPPPYYVQAQYTSAPNSPQMMQIGVQHPSASNQQQMMQIGVHQPPMTNIKH